MKKRGKKIKTKKGEKHIRNKKLRFEEKKIEKRLMSDVRCSGIY